MTPTQETPYLVYAAVLAEAQIRLADPRWVAGFIIVYPGRIVNLSTWDRAGQKYEYYFNEAFPDPPQHRCYKPQNPVWGFGEWLRHFTSQGAVCIAARFPPPS